MQRLTLLHANLKWAYRGRLRLWDGRAVETEGERGTRGLICDWVRKEYGCELGWPQITATGTRHHYPLSPNTMLKHFNSVPIQIFSFFLLNHTCYCCHPSVMHLPNWMKWSRRTVMTKPTQQHMLEVLCGFGMDAIPIARICCVHTYMVDMLCARRCCVQSLIWRICLQGKEHLLLPLPSSLWPQPSHHRRQKYWSCT